MLNQINKRAAAYKKKPRDQQVWMRGSAATSLFRKPAVGKWLYDQRLKAQPPAYLQKAMAASMRANEPQYLYRLLCSKANTPRKAPTTTPKERSKPARVKSEVVDSNLEYLEQPKRRRRGARVRSVLGKRVRVDLLNQTSLDLNVGSDGMMIDLVKLSKEHTGGYKNVSLMGTKYGAHLHYLPPGESGVEKMRHLGTFNSAEQACLAVCSKQIELGRFVPQISREVAASNSAYTDFQLMPESEPVDSKPETHEPEAPAQAPCLRDDSATKSPEKLAESAVDPTGAAAAASDGAVKCEQTEGTVPVIQPDSTPEPMEVDTKEQVVKEEIEVPQELPSQVELRCSELHVDDQIEALDADGLWFCAVVKATEEGRVLMSYNGWSTENDEWITDNESRLRKSRGWGTSKVASDWQIGAHIEVSDEDGHWHKAQVMVVSELTVLVEYETAGKEAEWIEKVAGAIRKIKRKLGRPKKSDKPVEPVSKGQPGKEEGPGINNFDLPAGWHVQFKTRLTGATAGSRDMIVTAPNGAQFRSICKIEAFFTKTKVESATQKEIMEAIRLEKSQLPEVVFEAEEAEETEDVRLYLSARIFLICWCAGGDSRREEDFQKVV